MRIKPRQKRSQVGRRDRPARSFRPLHRKPAGHRMEPRQSRHHGEAEPCGSGWDRSRRGESPRGAWETSGARPSADRQEWISAPSLDLSIGRPCDVTHTAAGSSTDESQPDFRRRKNPTKTSGRSQPRLRRAPWTMSAFRADALTTSPSWKSMARTDLLSSRVLKSPFGSFS